MRAGARASGLPVAAVLAASAACEIVRPVDPFEAHPDVVAIAVLLVEGESEARVAVLHPHRQWSDAKPRFSATLEGPGWTAEFHRELRLPACGRTGASWHVPARCVGAPLPEPIEPGATYGIRGEAPLGSFSGEMTVPIVPQLLEPEYLKSLPMPDEAGLLDIPIEYQSGGDIGTLLADVFDVLETMADGTEVEVPVSHLGPFPNTLGNAEQDTVSIYQDSRPLRFQLRLFGVGNNYTNFVKYTGVDPLPRPWPEFGIEGEGVYGYFGGLVHSRSVPISVGPVGNPNRTN